MPRLTDAKWEQLEAEYHTGEYTKTELSNKYNVSRAAINKRIGDIEPKHKEKVTAISTMKADLANESYAEVTAVETAIERRTKHIMLFENSALENQRKANLAISKLKDKDIDEKVLYPLETHSKITQRNKETVLGKDKTTEISQTQQTEVKSISVTYE